MELAIQRKPIQGIDGQDKIHQTIKHKDIGHIAYILSAKLYSDPVLAVVREYICNGTDAHVECGKKDLSVQVHAPSDLEPWFSVRDFGKGITFEQMQDMYIHLGDSSKRESNDGIGCFGIGNMAFRAYTDGMTVTSRCQGEKTVYSLQVGEDNKVFAVILSKEPMLKREVSGVEISIAVKNCDVSEFRKKIAFFGKFMEVKPKTSVEIEEIEIEIEAEDGSWFFPKCDRTGWRSKTTSYIVMGGCPYQISNFEGITDKQKSMLEDGVIIKVPLGSVGITPDREKLEYSPQTIRFIKKKLNDISNEVLSKAQADLDSETSYYNFVLKMNNFESIKAFSLSDIKFKGERVYTKLSPIKRDGTKISFEGIIKYIRNQSNGSVIGTDTGRWASHDLTINEKTCVVVDDSTSAINQRLKTIHEELGFDRFYVVNENAPNYHLFEKRYHLDTWGDKQKLYASKFTPMPTKGTTASTLGMNTRGDIKLFSLRWNILGSCISGETKYWGDVDNEIDEKETKYYFPIERYKIVDNKKNYSLSDFNTNQKSVLHRMFPEVYGVRKNDVKNLDSTWKNILTEIDNNWEKLIEGEILDSLVNEYKNDNIWKSWVITGKVEELLEKYPTMKMAVKAVSKESTHSYHHGIGMQFRSLLCMIGRDFDSKIEAKIEGLLSGSKTFKLAKFLFEECPMVVGVFDNHIYSRYNSKRDLTDSMIRDINDYMKTKEPKAKEIV